MDHCTPRTANRSRANRQPRLQVLSGSSRMPRSAPSRRSAFGSSVPGVPRLLSGSNGELLLVANEGHAEQQGLETEFLEPPLIAEPSRPQPELPETTGIAI